MVVTSNTFCNVKKLCISPTPFKCFFMVLRMTAIIGWVIQQTRNVCSEVGNNYI